MKRRTFVAWFAGLFTALLATTAVANPVHDQISSMAEKDRAAAFSKMLQASGEKCASISRTFHQGNDKGGSAFWNVQCGGGKAFVVTVHKNGSTRYMECAQLAQLKAGQCFVKFKA